MNIKVGKREADFRLERCETSLLWIYMKDCFPSLPFLWNSTSSWNSELTMMLPICLRTETSHQEPTITFATLYRYFFLLYHHHHWPFMDYISARFLWCQLSNLSSMTGSENELSGSDKNDMIAPKCPPTSPNGFIRILNMTGSTVGS